ncbi:MAG: hypothetical protein IMX00_04550 [Limnochordales bacterium]|nr:hypothetical protein [Limnochordales bacterium]
MQTTGLRRSMLVVLVSVLMLAFAAVGAVPASHAAGSIEQLVRADGKSLIITARNQLQVQGIEGYYHLMMVYTPDFTQPITVLGSPTTVIAVSGGKVIATEKVPSGGQVKLPIPADGYLVVGIGRGSVFLDAVKVGDEVRIIERDSVTPDPQPTMVVAENGESYPITAWNTGRGPNELIVYTPDWGNNTYTNFWGAEALVQNGEVIYVRQLREDPALDIPDDGLVISGHDAAGYWILANLVPGTKVSFE